jgi:hypothetical protein
VCRVAGFEVGTRTPQLVPMAGILLNIDLSKNYQSKIITIRLSSHIDHLIQPSLTATGQEITPPFHLVLPRFLTSSCPAKSAFRSFCVSGFAEFGAVGSDEAIEPVRSPQSHTCLTRYLSRYQEPLPGCVEENRCKLWPHLHKPRPGNSPYKEGSNLRFQHH